MSMRWPKNGERFTFQGMARTNNGDSPGKVLMMGSVSQFPWYDSMYFDATCPPIIGLEKREFLAHDFKENRAKMLV